MTIIKNFLVPTDFSESADAALRVAADLARLHHAGVTLLHVHEPATFELPDGLVQSASSQLGRVFDDYNERLSRGEAFLRSHGVQRAETRAVSGEVVDEIIKYSSEFDSVVLGTHGRKGLERLVMGSVAQKVLERATCTVIVVRSPQKPD
jgi:nucleotide-binding universal stress UspA family protein